MAARKTRPRKRPKITKLGWRDVEEELEDTGATLQELEEECANAVTHEYKGSLKVDRANIFVAGSVFQWRIANQDSVARLDHILELARVVRESGRPLDEILVFPIGAKFYVVDGHHRLAAYDAAKWLKKIPAKAFVGTVHEAAAAALELNSKNKLPMTAGDKQEAAWRIVRSKEGSTKDDINARTSVSTSSIGSMRATLKRLQLAGRSPEDIEALPWRLARMENVDVEYLADDEWEEKQANKMVRAWLKSKLGQGLSKDPAITALALSKLNPALPELLMGAWMRDGDLSEFAREFLEQRKYPVGF